MSKRVCPFEDHCEPQRKQHVATRDIDLRDESYRKSIYDKTLSLLFAGMNNNNVLSQTGVALSDANANLPPAHRLCVECNDIKFIQGNCWFCEVSLCPECIKSCSICSEQFCSRCCVAIFKNGNNYCCLTCYS